MMIRYNLLVNRNYTIGVVIEYISCKMNCNMEDKYSKEWKQVNIAYNEYRQSLALFLACDEEQIYNDLSKSCLLYTSPSPRDVT